VTGICSTHNLELVHSIGADQVVDYTQTNFSQIGQQYDLIFDTIGNISISDARRALLPRGRCVVAGFTTLLHVLELGLFGNLRSGNAEKKIGMMGTAEVKRQDLVLIQELLETGKIVPVIDRIYPLRETANAIAYLEQGHARGKVMVSVI
jgi:NADPH:quinone reductase-like Zn-dependent oxidoreductase